MRIKLAVLFAVLLGAVSDAARADPYRWCAVYAGGMDGGSSNCGFVTLQQCQATVSGVGGFCAHNNFYTGPRVEPAPRRKRPAQR